MSPKDDLGPPVPPGTRLRALFVFLVFLVLMPLLGAVVFLTVLLTILHGLQGTKLSSIFAAKPTELWMATKLIATWSYVFGGAQATFVAVVAGLVQLVRPSDFVRVTPMLIASLIAGGCCLLVVVPGLGPRAEHVILAVLVVHLGAGIGCWLIANAVLWPFRNRQLSRGAEPSQRPAA